MAATKQTRYPFTVIRQRLRQRGDAVLDFAMGRHTQTVPADLSQFITQNITLATRRRTQSEVEAFTQCAAAMLQRDYQVTVDPADILPTPGGRPAMSGIVSSLLSPNDGVLVMQPGYPAFAPLAAAQHALVHEVELDPDQDFAPNTAALGADQLADVRIVSLNYPNNPTAALLSNDLIDALGSRLPPDTIIFNDAVYAPLTFEAPPQSLLSWNGRQPLLELHGLGKLFPIGPLAIAILVGAEPLISRIRDHGDYAWPQLSSLQLKVAMRCIEDTEHLNTLRKDIASRVTALHRVLGELGLAPYPTPAGQYVLCPVPTSIRGTPMKDAGHAAEVLLDQYDLAVMPWETDHHGYLRFSSLYLAEELERLRQLAPLGD